MISLNCVRGVVFGLMLFFSSFYGSLLFGAGFVPLLFVSPKLYRKHFDLMIASWESLCSGLLEYWLGIRVVISGDEVQPGERNLIIMNHRTRLDWLYFWSVLVRQSGLRTEKIILKSPLKKIPGAGWAMQVGAFIFIHRNWEEDQQVLDKMLNYFSHLKHQTQVLLFPEGTDLTSRSKVRSDQFAEKNGWPAYNHCLHPRTTGFVHLTQAMRDNQHLDAVYDVTVAYSHNFPQTEPQLILGNIPKEVHFHVRRHAIDSLPSDDDGLKTWCQDRWAEKEARLEQFHKDKKFPDGAESTKPRSGLRGEVTMCLALVYWTVFVIGITVLLYHSAIARYLAAAQVVFFLYMSHIYGGLELFQADYTNWLRGKHKKA